jgi:hypothetical protein
MPTVGNLPIEPYWDDETWGVVRNPGWPVLVAARPERWRFERLAEVLVAARAIAELRLGAGVGEKLIAAMTEFSDAKGDFTVSWRPADRHPDYEAAVNEALAQQGEDEIVHIDSDGRAGS